jgi:putative ABC transport system ATP-binding protein
LSLLRATDVSKSYGDLEVLSGVTFEIESGQVKAIIGPSGSGKSTLLRCLALLEHPDSGTVTLGDSAPGPGEVGMVFQRFNLFQNMNALDNVMCALVEVRRLAKDEARDQARAFLERVGLADKEAQFPDELSGGQQQRVAIARALVSNPKLILADEPTGNLDTANGEAVMDLLTGVSQSGTTVIMVTHSLVHAARAQRTVKLLDGHVVNETLLAA